MRARIRGLSFSQRTHFSDEDDVRVTLCHVEKSKIEARCGGAKPKSRFFSTGNSSRAVLPPRLTRPTADFHVSAAANSRNCDRAPLRGQIFFRVLRRRKAKFLPKTRALAQPQARRDRLENAHIALRLEPRGGGSRRPHAKSAARAAVVRGAPQPARRRESTGASVSMHESSRTARRSRCRG